MQNKLRSWVLATIVGVILLAAGSSFTHAYQGNEHIAASNLGFELALMSLLEQGVLSTAEAEELRDSYLGCALARSNRRDCVPFGAINSAVDRVFRPEALVPVEFLHDATSNVRNQLAASLPAWAPERCGQFRHLVPVPEVLDEMRNFRSRNENVFEPFPFGVGRVARKTWPWMRLLIVHQNTNHFEACAAAKYSQLHALALELARPSNGAPYESNLAAALFAEGAAQHFLQDAIAPGHLMTARGNASDLIGRFLHNRNNRQLLLGRFDSNDWQPWADRIDKLLSAQSPDCPNLTKTSDPIESALCRLPDEPLTQLRDWNAPDEIERRSKDLGPLATLRRGPPIKKQADVARTELEQIGKTETTCGSQPCSSIGMLGDGDASHNRVFVALAVLSARSVEEVLLHHTRPDSDLASNPMGFWFRLWSAEATENGLPNEETLQRPGMAMTSSSTGIATEPNAAFPYETFFGFHPTESGNLDRFGWSPGPGEVSLSFLKSGADDQEGMRYEASWLFGSPREEDICRNPATQEGGCTETGNRFTQVYGSLVNGPVLSWSMSYEDWNHFDAYGPKLRWWSHLKSAGGPRIDFLWGVDLGLKRYTNAARTTDRLVWGGHIATGFSIVFLDLGIERGSVLNRAGEQMRSTNTSLSLRIQLPF